MPAQKTLVNGVLRVMRGAEEAIGNAHEPRALLPVNLGGHGFTVPAAASAVWDRVVHPDGINHEMRPWMTMNMPRGATGLTVETVPLGRPLGRAWLRLFGLIPFDFDHLTIVELEAGSRFLERSTMLSMRRWEHERTLTPVAGGTRVHDRVTLQPRLPIPGLGALLARVVDAFFKHRHRRLHKYFVG